MKSFNTCIVTSGLQRRQMPHEVLPQDLRIRRRMFAEQLLHLRPEFRVGQHGAKGANYFRTISNANTLDHG
jgi:hypothetical protein